MKLLKPRIWEDERGYFYESYNATELSRFGIDVAFVQDNQAKSRKGVLRGLHYQTGPAAQAKLVRALEGEVLDVVVDIRPKSSTYGLSFQVVLSAANHLQLYVPRGFAHGYITLSDSAIFCYKCDNFYNQSYEGGINYADPTLDIAWPLDSDEMIISKKDILLPFFGAHRTFE